MKQKLVLLWTLLLLSLSVWLGLSTNATKSTANNKQACKNPCHKDGDKSLHTGFLLFDAFSGAL